MIMPLVDLGLVVVGNLRAREPVALDTALEQGITQQWVQVTPGFEGLAGDPPPKREVVETVADETVAEFVRRTLVVEFNVLNAVRYVEQHGVRLNRDGSPHRSDLKALAPIIIDRPGPGRSDPTPDPLAVDGWDLVLFLLSLAEGLELLERRGELLRALPAGATYFQKPLAERLPLLMRALEHHRAWSEIDSSQWFSAGEPPATGNGDGAFLTQDEQDRVVKLAGARSSVFAALRRLNATEWFDVDETVRTITGLEQRYLSSALPQGASSEASVSEFIKTAITRSLVHVGAVEIGRGSDGQARARITDIGKYMLGMAECPEEVNGRGAILVEPNFEVTCFLDMANLQVLFDLSRFAELVRVSERIVRYRLQGESAQWGYARGYTADGIVEILSEFSAQGIPPAVTFALQDWERLHRRVTVFLHGDVIGAIGRVDPEVVQSAITFTVDGPDEVEIIDDIHTFVAAGHGEPLERALTAHKPQIIDYNESIVPTLEWLDEERLRAPIGATDLRTLSALQLVTVKEDDETYRIAPDKVRSAYGEDDGYSHLVVLLREGLIGGLSAEREILLKRLLGRPADAGIETMQVLLLSSPEDGDRIARIEPLREFIERRLGPTAFQVRPGVDEKLANQLRELGISVEMKD